VRGDGIVMVISIGICDDDVVDLNKIISMVKKYGKLNNIIINIKEFCSGEDLLNNYEEFDMVFLDISMKGINGIQVGNELKKLNRQAKIIYTTSFRQFIEPALNNVHAFSYMVKPVAFEVLKNQMDEVTKYICDEKQELDNIIFSIIEVTQEGKIEYSKKHFNYNEIYYFEYINRRIKVKLAREEYFFTKSMKDLVKEMNEYNFELCHQNFLVSLMHIKRIKGYEINLDNGECIPVSQKKSATIRKSLNQYIHSTP
jgi:DNA-binding LytR/AlgR family response regulator